jgi:CO/xanthine dehydrogenase FAD-binding subunit
MVNFDYRKPIDLKEALSLRNKWGKASSLLLGGTDLFLAIDGGVCVPEMLIDLKNIEELNLIKDSGDMVKIGARVTYSALIDSPLVKKNLPAIWESSRLVASIGIRNAATLVGNICNAVPSAESASPLMVRNALVHLVSVDGKRDVSIRDFFTGPRRTVLKENEIVVAVSVPKVRKKFGEAYVKLGRYRGQDIAQVAVSVLVDSDWNYSIAYAAVGPVPMRIPHAESILQGKELTPQLMMKAQEAVINTVSPISDIRASKEYRIHMCRVMFEKAINAAVSRMVSSQPEYGIRLI